MAILGTATIVAASLWLARPSLAQTPTSPLFTPIPTLNTSINAAPSLVPTISDPTAPIAQDLCPGYKALNVEATAHGYTADLTLAGEPCHAYGNDIVDLSLVVEYQNQQRLNVKIVPRYLNSANTSQYILPESLTGLPGVDEGASLTGNDLNFTYSNTPSFQFEISRGNEVIFSTMGTVLVFEDQFLELVTSMVPDYNVYGLSDGINNFRLGNNFTRTFYAIDNGNPINSNLYGTHPVYLENRYQNNSASLSHGVYARNAHGQEWLLRDGNITYRTIGGSFDFYFLSGPTAKEVIAQYQGGIIGYPAMQMYWTFGYHQCRWGYQNWSVMQDVVDSYANAGIQLETIWNDIDYMDEYRDFTNGPLNFPVPAGRDFLNKLHAAGQHYVPIVDSNIYAPDPTNSSDSYDVYTRGAELGAFIRNSDGTFYYGDQWPGFSVWPDFLGPTAQDFWTFELANWHHDIPFDGIWIDLSEASSYCVGSCGTGQLNINPAHPPFALPGDPGNLVLDYPEDFNATNSTAAASASSASTSQASMSSATAASTSSSSAYPTTVPTPGIRNLNFPPYVINSFLAGHSLVKGGIAPNATHNDAFNTTEYEQHNLFGLQISNATYHALLNIFPNRRPFTVGRSTFAGSGTVTSHWGGDNYSKWPSMYFSISQALQFAIAGIPMFGVDTCGFAGNTDYELCSRWMQLSAFFPFYRNHNTITAISQEAYVWESVAEATRTVMSIRYSLLPYIYTLFHAAHTQAETVMRALAWEFPNDPQLAAVDNQFMLGPSLLITPVLEPQVSSVKGIFPGVSQGTIWYDWYTLERVEAQAGVNTTIDAPLGHIPVFIRGGSILVLQQPGNTTATSRQNPYNLIIALDSRGMASGSLYLDDGESLIQNATKYIEISYASESITLNITGSFVDTNPLGNVTITGAKASTRNITLNGLSLQGGLTAFANNVLRITGLESLTRGGIFQGVSKEISSTLNAPVTQISDGQIRVPVTDHAMDAQVQSTALP
ncbi:MAG: hypothetical protein Q9191_000620 [Dirinaria sp. TL-2023a]